jgi:hypothetical protein
MAFQAGILVGSKQTTFIPTFEFSGIKNEHQVTDIQSDKLTAPDNHSETFDDVSSHIAWGMPSGIFRRNTSEGICEHQ